RCGPAWGLEGPWLRTQIPSQKSSREMVAAQDRLPPEARFLRAHQPLDAERIASLVGGGPGRREVKAARDFQHPVCAPASRRTLERADGPQENTLGPLLF